MVHCAEIIKEIMPYVIRHPLRKGSCSVQYSASSWTWTEPFWPQTKGSVQGSGRGYEPNQWFSLGFRKMGLWTKLNQTFPSLVAKCFIEKCGYSVLDPLSWTVTHCHSPNIEPPLPQIEPQLVVCVTLSVTWSHFTIFTTPRFHRKKTWSTAC